MTNALPVMITRRFRGPELSGNGGYACGLVASALVKPPDEKKAVEVMLRKPPPLDAGLTIVVSQDGERATLHGGDDEIASAAVLALELAVPEPPTLEEAVAAARGYRGFHAHPYPGCFVCGPERAEGDGLRIFPGRVGTRELVAAPFTASRSLATDVLDTAVVWAALDCPGYFGATLTDLGNPTLLLGKMHAEILHAVHVGAPHVVIGFPLGREGRKLFGGTALFDAQGRLVARSRQVWIAPKPA